LRALSLPNKIISVVKPINDELHDVLPLVKNKILIDNKARAYVCEGGVCEEPTFVITKYKLQLLERSK